MNKAQREKERAFEIIIKCVRCKQERSEVRTMETINEVPKPCKHCGGRDWDWVTKPT